MNRTTKFIVLIIWLSFLVPFKSWSGDVQNIVKNEDSVGDKCIPSDERKRIEADIKTNSGILEEKKKTDRNCKPVSKFCLYKTKFNFYCGSIEIPSVKTDYCLNSYQNYCYKIKDNEVKFFNTIKECENYNKLIYH